MSTTARFWGVAMLSAFLCLAQSAEAPKEPVKFYKLDFFVKEVEGGKVLSARNYSVIVSTNGPAAQIRAGSNVPSLASYQRVGTDIDCKNVVELNNEMSMDLKVEVSSLLQDNDPHPVIRQNTWQSSIVVPLRKPTVVFSSDDNTTKRALQFEVIATPKADSK